MYIVKGFIGRKKYTSRKKFRTEGGALKHGYKKTYNPSGNTKRKKQLSNWRVVKVKK